MKYQAIIFDLFGTLVDVFSRQEYERTLAEMVSILNVPYNEFYKVWMETAKQRGTGVFRTVEENLEYICRELKAPVTGIKIKAATRIRLDYVTRALTPRRDAIETLSSLKTAGYKIGLISNCSTEPPGLWQKTPFAPYFNATIFSSTAGVQKPDPRIFQMAINKLKVTAQKCLYVGDDDSNELAAAAGMGMHPVLIRAAHEDSANALRSSETNGRFNYPKISSLKEVLNLLDQPGKD